MNHGIVRPRHRPWATWTAAPGTIVTTALVDDPDERDGPTLDEMEQEREPFDANPDAPAWPQPKAEED